MQRGLTTIFYALHCTKRRLVEVKKKEEKSAGVTYVTECRYGVLQQLTFLFVTHGLICVRARHDINTEPALVATCQAVFILICHLSFASNSPFPFLLSTA